MKNDMYNKSIDTKGGFTLYIKHLIIINFF